MWPQPKTDGPEINTTKRTKFEALREPSLRDASGDMGQPHGAMGATPLEALRSHLRPAAFMGFMSFTVQKSVYGGPNTRDRMKMYAARGNSSPFAAPREVRASQTLARIATRSVAGGGTVPPRKECQRHIPLRPSPFALRTLR